MTDDEFLAAFESLRLPAPAFDHRAHLRLAWILLSREDRLVASERFVRGLKAFAAHHGVPGKYHETLTFFFLNLLADRMAASDGPAEDWAAFEAGHPELCGDYRALVDAHYEPATIASPFARSHFVLPDRARFAAAGQRADAT